MSPGTASVSAGASHEGEVDMPLRRVVGPTGIAYLNSNYFTTMVPIMN
jgi:hypothetical protein